jgi:hypothetical protein
MGRRKRTSRKSGSGLTLVHNSPRMPMMPEMDLDRSIIPISMSPQGSMDSMMMGSPLPHGLVSPVILSDLKSPRPYRTIVLPTKSSSKSSKRKSSGRKRTGKKPVKPMSKKPSSRPIRRAVNNVVKKVTPKKYINKPKITSGRKSRKSMDEAMKRLSAPKRSSRKSSSKMSASKKRQLRRDFMKEQADIENML